MFHKFKKGSPEAKAHMAKLRAMVGKKRKKNPLTEPEAKAVMRRARRSMDLSRTMKPQSFSHGYFSGTAIGRQDVVEDFGPKRRKNPPLLIIGNPGKKRRKKFHRPKASSFGECPKDFPAHIWRDPQFQAERRIFIKRHGANVPITVTKVKMPPGSPKFMTAYGRAQHAVYDAPKERIGGSRFKHSFGKKGKNKPWLVSSASRGPKWLGYAGGTFKAKDRWLYD